MKRIKRIAAALDARPVCDIELTYEKLDGAWRLFVVVYPAGKDDGFVKSWPCAAGMVTSGQLIDIGAYLQAVAAGQISELIPVRGLQPGT